ncbi:MAG TPA: trypsin-like peptidase domain-containing protein [Solirubrobacteraceae bacterium]|nr:trypsin-like peptidase domain-containing protein [Solirubrobacteraceae bacterium]
MRQIAVRPRRTAGTVVAAGLGAIAIAAVIVAVAGAFSRDSDAAGGLQAKFTRLVQTVSPKVVEIRTSTALGSGIVYDSRGDVVTNAHVVGNSAKMTIRLSDGSRHSASLVGTSPGNDLAIVRLTGATPRPATFADSSKLQVGDLALAIGNPLGLASSVSQGIVSSTGRDIPEGNGVMLKGAIQTSAAINPGNSGGALVNLSDQVIGIPTLAAVDRQIGNSAAPGIGFAIPSNTVRRVADQLIAGH